MLKTLLVGKASSWSTGSVATPPSHTADPSRGCTVQVTQGLNRVDGIFGIYSTGVFKIVEILVKTTENTIRYIIKFTYTRRSHMTVSNLLWDFSSGGLSVVQCTEFVHHYSTYDNIAKPVLGVAVILWMWSHLLWPALLSSRATITWTTEQPGDE